MLLTNVSWDKLGYIKMYKEVKSWLIFHSVRHKIIVKLFI